MMHRPVLAAITALSHHLDCRLTDLEERQLDRAQERQRAILDRLTALAHAIGALATHALNLGSAVARLSDRQEALMGLIDDIVGKVTTLTSVTDGLGTALDSVLALLTATKAQLDAVLASGGLTPDQTAALTGISTGLDTEIATLTADKDKAVAAVVAGTPVDPAATPQP